MTYIIGVWFSPAGHYVPATGQVIVESNSIYAKNLKGIGIGNGWVDPLLQYADYSKVSPSPKTLPNPTEILLCALIRIWPHLGLKVIILRDVEKGDWFYQRLWIWMRDADSEAVSIYLVLRINNVHVRMMI